MLPNEILLEKLNKGGKQEVQHAQGWEGRVVKYKRPWSKKVCVHILYIGHSTVFFRV